MMHAMETGWTAKHGTPSEKDAAIEKLNALRTSENLSFDTLRAFFAQMSGVHRESALSGKNEQNGDFAGAAVGGGSHEFTAPGLARHNELHPDHRKNYDLLKGQQIMEPISASIDCRVCNGTHAPGNCKQKQRRDRASSRGRVPFSGHASAVDRASGIQDVNRYASLQRTIENELAERHD